MAACTDCQEPLLLQVQDDEDSAEPTSVPDDLQLPCGCHYHWQCLMDQSPDIAISLKCPGCGAQLAANVAGPSVTNPFLHASSGVTILTRYTNEGGVDENLDILPAITEEAYLASNPEARPARAFHVMCGEGDVQGIMDLLRDSEQPGDGDDEDSPNLDPVALLRYQDPLAGMQSALHLAVKSRQEEVVWLLLWLSSPLSQHAFPEVAAQTARVMGLPRLAASLDGDIRALQDENGRTAEAVAAEMDGVWMPMLQAGALHPGA